MKSLRKKKKRAWNQDPLHEDRKLITRRDFLASGVIGFSGSVMIPSLLSTVLLERSARAGGTSGNIPFIIFDCAGGAALPGNWMPSSQPGLFNSSNILQSYSTLGLGNSSQYKVDTSFGTPMAAPNPPTITSPTITSTQFSKIYQTLVTQLNSNILGSQANLNLDGFWTGISPQFPKSKLQMGIIPANSSSDSQTNMFSPISLISAAGLTGKYVKTGLGMTAAQSGGNSDWGSGSPGFKPLQIHSVTALSSALSYGNALQGLGTGALTNLANTIYNLSSGQAAKFQSMTLGDQFNSLMQSSFQANKGSVNGVTGIDPRVDSDAQTAYGITANSNPSDSTVVQATLVLNAVTGNSGPVVLTIGGCDYHDGTQTSGDGVDTGIGAAIARAMNLAYAKNQKVAFAVYTDGGIYSDPGQRTWRGDDNLHGLAVFGVMDPTTQPVLAQTQVGQYTCVTNADGSSVQNTDPGFVVGNDPLKVCHALFLNYLAVTGQVGNYTSLITQQDGRNTSLLPNVYSGQTFSQWSNRLLLFPNSAG